MGKVREITPIDRLRHEAYIWSITDPHTPLEEPSGIIARILPENISAPIIGHLFRIGKIVRKGRRAGQWISERE